MALGDHVRSPPGDAGATLGDGHGVSKMTNNHTEYLVLHRIARTIHPSKGIYKAYPNEHRSKNMDNMCHF